MTLELGFLKLDYRSVNEVIGVPIFVDNCCSPVLAVVVVGVETYAFFPCFKKA
jgi:hypothetical protein